MAATWGFGVWNGNAWGSDNNINVVSGIGASFSLGSVTIDAELNSGWGRLTWGENAWGEQGDVVLSGISMSASLGNEVISIDVNPVPTGIPLTAVEGTVTEIIAVEVPVTGINLTSNLGTADAGPDAMLQGIGATGSVGSVEAYNLEGWGRYFWGQFEWGATGEWESVTPTGISMSANVGTIAATGNAEITLDSSIQFTAEGNAQLSTAQQKFGSASLLLDGTDDSVDSTTNLDLSSTDFTVDVWIRPDNVTGYKGIWQSGTSTTEQSYLLGNQVYWSVNPSTIITTSVTVNANEWTMLSYERQGNTHRIYKNGTLEDTATTGNKQDNGPFTIGKNGFGDFDGYIDEFRVSDIARYEGSSFTEPTSEFSVDSDTVALLHFNGANGSTDIINSVPNNAFAMTANEGTVDPAPDAEVTGIGFDASLAVGTVVIGEANVTVVGEGIAAGLGLGTIDLNTPVDLTGIAMSANLGSVTIIAEGKVTLTGLGLTMAEGTNRTLIWNQVNTGTAPTWTEVDTAA
jgi:hypothetical protein